STYSGEEAKLIGQSIWNYIGKQYGENSISNIISFTRAFRNERESIESNLGIHISDFLKLWEDYYKKINQPLTSYYSYWPDSSILVKGRKNDRIYSLKMNKEGTNISFIQNKKGRYRLRVLNTLTGKSKTILRGGYKRDDQVIDYMLPVSTWQNEFILSAIVRRRGELRIENFDLKAHQKKHRKLPGFNQIYSISYSSDGRQMVMSADRSGQTDLFVYTPSTNNIVQITNDAYDDVDPVFTSNNNILFSSNRRSDTINAKRIDLPKYTDHYNLYLYSTLNNSLLQKITFKGNNFMPQIVDQQTIYFLSDETGIVNTYKFDLNYNSISPITNQITDITSFAYSGAKSSLCFTALHKGRDCIYYKIRLFSMASLHGPNTTRKNLVISYSPNELEAEPVVDSVNFNFNSSQESDFDKLIFESDVKKEISQAKKNSEQPYVPKLNAFRYIGPKKYNNPFSVDKIVSTLMVDPIRGLGMLLEGGTSDLLGNHRIDAGDFIAFDFKSSKFFMEYRYVKRRIDLKVRYDRQTLNPYNDFATQRYVLNSFRGTASLPLSVTQRVGVSAGITSTSYSETTSFANVAQKPQIATYESLRAEYVYDNTLVTGMNMLKGTRFKISTDYYVSNQSRQKDFGLFLLDFRKYIPVHKQLVFATRISYGQYFGNAPKNFLLGGMENWLFSNRTFYSNANAVTDNPLSINQGVNNSDMLFVRYVTTIRGFNYNSQFGNQYLLFNGELRLPVVQYFYNGTISSNFLRNLQVIGFTDIGSAFSGSLFASNSQNTKTINGYPFSATVTNYQSPFIVGFGGGLRTTLLGYYVKTDLGWGYQNGILYKPILYFTFGYDF
ncbi:MAG TPA: hypothetical protein VK766_04595, partial [Cytophagaceae bacterium]|nr:hypothetical protein [Cytophagaceae bacterium]